MRLRPLHAHSRHGPGSLMPGHLPTPRLHVRCAPLSLSHSIHDVSVFLHTLNTTHTSSPHSPPSNHLLRLMQLQTSPAELPSCGHCPPEPWHGEES